MSIVDWNNQGVIEDLLKELFKKLDTDDQVVVHNYAWAKLRTIVGDSLEEFYKHVAGIIESLGLRNLSDGEARTQAKTKTEARPGPLDQREGA